MKVLLLSISLEGGAGSAPYRIHQSLQHLGVTSKVLVQTKAIDDETVLLAPTSRLARAVSGLRPKLDRLPLRFYPNCNRFFSVQWLPDSVLAHVKRFRPDVINLHWVLNGYVRIETIPKLNKPIIWTLHDMWPFTGGCDYSHDCTRYMDSCGACPVLDSHKERDLSRWIWRRKAKAWQNLDLTIVTPSTWLAECARASSLFKDKRIEVIPIGIDTEIFRPLDKQAARQILDLPQDKYIILFGAWINDRRKGFHLLQEALQVLSKSGWQDKIEVVIFGFSEPSKQPDLGFKAHFLGKLNDKISLAMAYAAADVFVAPSIYENLSATVIEAMACGTPSVAFKVGGMPDMIEHRQNGYVAQPYDIEDLAQGIAWVLSDRERHQRLSRCVRAKAKREYSMEVQGQRYLALLNEIVENHNRSGNASK